ncbi:hypothetical protein B0A48_17844 [Cryoendolithus antarcticus]|uniref:Transcription factor domain-containing protein n=1 Tax=Cryoendolithus antarcticus TaxID=1507870 RepID=A0A1V8S9Z7_9PEZI|nr:hypothetical protein B0A48_17844 [Cryoendolithus antarcticus]
MEGPLSDDSRANGHGEAPAANRPGLKRSRSSYEKPPPAAPSQRAESIDDVHSGNESKMSDSMELKGLRFPADPLDYPRRRATIAWIKLDAGDKLILERLARIEGLLQLSHSNSPGDRHIGPISPATSNTASDDTHVLKRVSTTSAPGNVPPLNGLGTWQANISTMPKAHTTPALHLLQWPIIRELVSLQCDPQVLLQLEMARPPLELGRYSLDFSAAHAYARAFFERVNVCLPDSCIVLLVLALGQAAHSGLSISRLPVDQVPPGMAYFSAAWNLLPSLLTRNDVLSTQCHILASAYLLYLVRPLEAWNLLHNTSMKVQLLLSSSSSVPSQLRELGVRLYWNTLMIESDLLAEMDLPHSGVVSLEENMRLPRSFPYDSTMASLEELPGSDELWYFLAEIALRRLLNRVSHLIYNTERNKVTISSLDPVCAELDFQLTQWYEGLPAPVKFPRERLPAQNQVQTVLRLRYFACRTIIYRPYLLAVLADENCASELGVQDACRKCLEACIRQLEYITAHHDGHLPYLWQGALSIVSQSLLLMGATLSSSLAALLPPAHQMNVIIAEVVAEVERMAHLAPSIRLCAEIMREAEERRQALLQIQAQTQPQGRA